MTGGFLTLTTSPSFSGREGFTVVPPMVTRPFLQASAAMLRVLKIRAAQSHLSILASTILIYDLTIYDFYYLTIYLSVRSTPLPTWGGGGGEAFSY